MIPKISSRYFILLFSMPVAIVLSLSVGSLDLSVSEVFQCLIQSCKDESHDIVLFEIRLPRVLMGFFAGGTLALAGAVLQNVTRNPLTDPYLFGVVSGAGLGVVLLSSVFSANYTLGITLAAFIGAMAAIVLVLAIGRTVKRPNQMILVGVAVSFLLSALSQFFLYLSEPLASNRILFWLLGSLSHAQYSQVMLLAPVSLLSLVGLVFLSRQLDAIAVGDELASSLGVPVSRLKTILLVLCALMTALVVATCGGIAFVGLMIPHIVRQMFSPRSLPLLITTFLLGGVFLVLVDIIARQTLAHVELPLGVVTAALGSVFFIILLLKERTSP